MQTHLAHLQLNVRPANLPFSKDLMAVLGWQMLFGNDEMLGVADTGDVSLWFIGQVNEASYDYDEPGLNHLAIGTAAQADVDGAAAYLRERGVELRFETPRHRPDFSHTEGHTYYQVMFETPDRVLVEIVFTGPRSE